MKSIFILLFAASVASGATIYNQASAWATASQVGNFYREDFDSVPFTVLTRSDTLSLANGFSITGEGQGALGLFGFNTIPAFPTTHLETDFETEETKLIFNFTEPIFAFGFYYTNADDANSIKIIISSIGVIYPSANPSTTSKTFFGITSDIPFNDFALTTGSSDQEYHIDDLTFVSVPEPATPQLILFACLVSLLYYRTRRCS